MRLCSSVSVLREGAHAVDANIIAITGHRGRICTSGIESVHRAKCVGFHWHARSRRRFFAVTRARTEHPAFRGAYSREHSLAATSWPLILGRPLTRASEERAPSPQRFVPAPRAAPRRHHRPWKTGFTVHKVIDGTGILTPLQGPVRDRFSTLMSPSEVLDVDPVAQQTKGRQPPFRAAAVQARVRDARPTERRPGSRKRSAASLRRTATDRRNGS
jgi:hypothetical protein